MRIHRSRIVRIDRIEQVEPFASRQYVVKMRSGLRLTSGRSHRVELRRAWARRTTAPGVVTPAIPANYRHSREGGNLMIPGVRGDDSGRRWIERNRLGDTAPPEMMKLIAYGPVGGRHVFDGHDFRYLDVGFGVVGTYTAASRAGPMLADHLGH